MGVTFIGSDPEWGAIALGVASKGSIDPFGGLGCNTVRIADNSAVRRSAAGPSLDYVDNNQF
jgi:hypothetical protein